jgi:dipeptidyl aminopeptidase/acylaminoacyl peptidase
MQLYAWDVPSGSLTRLTNQPAGVVLGTISPDGNSIYYLHDAQGNEIGHYVRVPFTGGEPEDLTPDMPPYASFAFQQSKTGRVTGFTSAGMDGFKIYVRIGAEAFKPIYHSGKLTYDPALSQDGEIAVVTSRERSVTLDASLVAFDTASGEQKRVVLEAGSAPSGIKWRPVTFDSTNGAIIQGWLATPEGDGPFPTILHTHSGPTSVMSDFYAPASQAWLDHGFAFLTINYHGSVTFGKALEKSIWGNLGDLEIDDMAAAYHWLVETHIAQPDAVLVTGGSYGGHLTLQALGRRPDLWAGGMAQVAIADWRLMYEDQAETLRGYQRALFGGAPDETPEATRRSSPITYAEQIQAPLLVIQGSNDTRCPARQMQAYEQTLNDLGKSIHIHWFDAGHGSRAIEQQIEHQEHMLRFAYRVLG